MILIQPVNICMYCTCIMIVIFGTTDKGKVRITIPEPAMCMGRVRNYYKKNHLILVHKEYKKLVGRGM